MSVYRIEIDCSGCRVYGDLSTARNIDKFKFVLM